MDVRISESESVPATLRSRDAILPGAMTVILVAAFTYLSPGLSLITTFVPAIILAYVCYLLTSFQRMPDPSRVLPVYLIAFAVQFLHFAEEFSTEFYSRWPVEVFNAAPFELTTFVQINMVSYAAFALGAVAIHRGIKGPMLIVWFFTLMGVIGNGVLHPIYPILATGEFGYFPGLYTSVIYLILGPILFHRLWEVRSDSGSAVNHDVETNSNTGSSQ
ncbi:MULTISPECIES: HXXEE domain-containing protein [unclassified Haloferax]|uniref:HXXEE domain-containing protein n=1 Tax=unclassified Haloferax TaxID=2625095 RepID=UPI000E23CCF3|nr:MULTISPECIES: HXXEE domain-containing protein [unclassified Haloferax]RDZ30443.1 HXXEE domain-containing protein [Haloferax sp. Atlit-48N]RDZ33945.1 HXXEE domain-containing protein [Haloferax sp. Atlit-24N]RLM33550.1 HXXEE domain-containing protein [Haloferax sp. Atlit-109R]RLM40871.1 HXXEE domain-containing protein [Haloferax sp. Atlit-105R]